MRNTWGLLVCAVLAAGSAGAQGLSWGDAEPLPASYRAGLAECLDLDAGAAEVWKAEMGRFFSLPFAGKDGKGARLWVGLHPSALADGESNPELYFAAYPEGASTPVECTVVSGVLDSLLPGSQLSVDKTADLPLVRVDAWGQTGCASESIAVVMGYLRSKDAYEVVLQEEHSSPRPQCADADSDEAQEERRLAKEEAAKVARHQKLNAQGLAAFKKGKLAEAEKAWREASATSLGALNNLGFLLQEQHRFADAEPLLLRTLVKDAERAVAWLNLADLYWDVGAKEAARPLYRVYAAKLNGKKGPALPERVQERAKAP